MPEGDTIHRAAARLHAALAGKTLNRLEARRLAPDALPPPGVEVSEVEARGKHLLVRFADGRTLHTHMRMSGSWHLYRPGERWMRPASTARVVLEADHAIAVCFGAPVVEVVRDDSAIATLGPDLTAADPDLEDVLRRVRAGDPAREIGEVLLDQRIGAGIGNVYKSEVLFARRIDPFGPVGTLSDSELLGLYATAARMLRHNLKTVRRTTAPGGLAVYRKAGRACPRCGSRILRAKQGRELPRSTYWCATCQRPAPAGGAGR